MKIRAVRVLLICASGLWGQSATEVGAGAPNDYIRVLFVNAYNRGRFATIAGTPAGPVRRYGATGLIQEFQAAGGARAALIRSSTLSEPDNSLADVFQVLPDLFTYYSSVGVATAGYPVTDTLSCPNAPCEYQRFATNHALFVWPAGTNDVSNVTVRDPFYSRWTAAGGVALIGPGTTAEEEITSTFGSNALYQRYTSGALYNITSGQLDGRFVSVRPPVAALYFAEKAHTGRLGLPASEEMLLPNGRKRQTFEGGSIEYGSDGGPVVRTPIVSIVLRPSTTPVRLNVGETVTIQALPISSEGGELTDRAVTFTTSNGRVVSITSSGQTVSVRAVGGGTANVTATAEGKTSAPVTFIVSATCCQIGEGAPTGVMQQAMQDVVTRNRLNVRLPAPERVRRVGAGYAQELQSADLAPSRYLITMSDRSAQAYAVTGATLSKYEEFGGPGAALGYPVSDRTAGGRQSFEGGALAGSPVQLVIGPILQKWATLSYEAGAAGLPSGGASNVTSISGASAQVQGFRNGLIVSTSKGAFFVTGLILSQYLGLNGVQGPVGFPAGDESLSGGKRRQEFEGGYIEFAPGDVEASAVIRQRRPAVSAVPASALPGSRIRLTVSGFGDGSTLRIISGSEPEFRVQTTAGAYSWDVYVAATTAPGSIRVRAIDAANPSITAETAYTVRSPSEVRSQLIRVSGDGQTGAPGAVLPLALRVAVQDESGNPLAGAAVRFTASPGAETNPTATQTDLNGFAETRLKMAAVEGVALVSVEAMRQLTTFSARASSASLTGFPKLMQTGTDPLGHGKRTLADAGSMLAAAAAMVRYLQIRGEAQSPNGAADITTLNNYLKNACTVDFLGRQYCDGFLTPPNSEEQIVNLWRLPAFAGETFAVEVHAADETLVRDAIIRGLPVLLPLAIQRNGSEAGAHYVVATGINSDGSLHIHDPKPLFARQNLNDYVRGFSLSGNNWTGKPVAAITFVPGNGSNTGFLVTSPAESISINMRTGTCGYTVDLPDTMAGEIDGRAPGLFRLRACDGSADEYEIDIGGKGPVKGSVTDLAGNGARFEIAAGSGTAFRASRPGTWLVIGPPETVLPARAIVNAATFTPDIAPGGLIAIFGSGLSRAGSTTRVEIGGRAASVLAAFPFQVNAVVPADLTPGTHILRIETIYGSVEQPVDVRNVAPAVFQAGPGQSAVVNQDGALNLPVTPARRGNSLVLYGTGFGATKPGGQFSVTQLPVSASILGQDMPVTYAGLAPGFEGLYQINVAIPLFTPVGAALPLVLRQGGVETRPVEVAIQ